MKPSLTILLCALALPSWAGISINIAVPDTLTPVTDSVVQNPVELETTPFDASQSDSYPGEFSEYGYQWLVGQWDHILNNGGYLNSKDTIDLPFTFSLNGVDYGKIGVYGYGYVVLLPADFEFSFNTFYQLDTDWSNPQGSTFQLGTYPTVFPLATNRTNSSASNWAIGATSNSDIVEGKTDLVLTKLEDDKAIVYSRRQIMRANGSDSFYHPLEQVVVLHSNGNIELHYDTSFPIEDMMVGTLEYESNTAAVGARLYSGIIIPRGPEGEVPLPMLNNITTNGAGHFLFDATTFANLTASDFPDDGSNVSAAAPVAFDTLDITATDVPNSLIFATNTASTTLTSDLAVNETYQWASRHVATYVEQNYSQVYASNWTAFDQFRVQTKNKDDDSSFLGSLNPLLALALSGLLLFRKRQPTA